MLDYPTADTAEKDLKPRKTLAAEEQSLVALAPISERIVELKSASMAGSTRQNKNTVAVHPLDDHCV